MFLCVLISRPRNEASRNQFLISRKVISRTSYFLSYMFWPPNTKSPVLCKAESSCCKSVCCWTEQDCERWHSSNHGSSPVYHIAHANRLPFCATIFEAFIVVKYWPWRCHACDTLLWLRTVEIIRRGIISFITGWMLSLHWNKKLLTYCSQVHVGLCY